MDDHMKQEDTNLLTLKEDILNGADLCLPGVKLISNASIMRMLDLYSSFSGQPQPFSKIAQYTSTPKHVVQYIIKDIFKVSPDDLPPTNERDIPKVVKALASRKMLILNELDRKADTDKDIAAINWQRMITNQLDPFKTVIEKYNPPTLQPQKAGRTPVKTSSTLLVGCSDWHYGIVADKTFLQRGQSWNLEETIKSVEAYGEWVVRQIQKEKPTRVILCFLGDLIHTLSGYTDKGTKLDFDCIGETLLERAITSLVNFISRIANSTHANVEVYSCGGNHSFFGDWVLMRFASAHLKALANTQFFITNKRSISFTVDNTPIVIEHGYAPNAKSRLPSKGPRRDAYVRTHFESLAITDRAYFLSADQHHIEQYECGSIEGYMFPTLVGGCRHADEMLHAQKPKQMALLLEDGHVVATKIFNYKKD